MTNGHGSDIQETPEWWLASDDRWYPPELHPDYVASDGPADQAPARADDRRPDADAPSLSERLRQAADRVGEEVSAAVDEVGDAAEEHADRVGPATTNLTPEMRATLGGAAATGVADTVAQPGEPEPSRVETPPAATEPSIPAVPEVPAVPPIPDVPPLPDAAEAPVVPPPVPEEPVAEIPPSYDGSPAGLVPPVPEVPAVPAPPLMSPAAPSVPPSAPPGPSLAAPPSAPPPDGDLGGTFGASPTGIAPPPAQPPPMPPAPPGITGGAPIGAPPVATPGPVPSAPPPTAPSAPASQPFTVPADGTGALTKRTSPLAGAVAGLGGAAAVAGSFLQWGSGSVESVSGVEQAIIEVAGFDSNGVLTLIFGALLLALALMLLTGALRQIYCAIAAFIAGGVIVGAVVFSMIDIADLSNRYAVEWEASGLAQVGDIVTTQPAIGLWVAGIGGVLGVLSAPLADRR